MIMRTGDKVLISPDLTHAKDWTQGEVIEVENNPFVGITSVRDNELYLKAL